jgi:hypothetical protein
VDITGRGSSEITVWAHIIASEIFGYNERKLYIVKEVNITEELNFSLFRGQTSFYMNRYLGTKTLYWEGIPNYL